jgi:chemotaxis family two-component system response regulator Rcp1
MTSQIKMKTIDILLVEDDAGDIRLTREAFKEGKVFNTLHVVGNGVEALAYLHNEGQYSSEIPPDIILLDLNLPKMDGREFLAIVKSDPLLRRIPVVILTTSKSDEDIIKSYNLHANCYINKPVIFDELVNVVKTIEDFWFTIVKLPPKVLLPNNGIEEN